MKDSVGLITTNQNRQVTQLPRQLELALFITDDVSGGVELVVMFKVKAPNYVF